MYISLISINICSGKSVKNDPKRHTQFGRINYNGDHFVYIDIYVDKYNIITYVLHRLENSPRKTF